LDRKGERKAGEWKRIGDGPNGWVMVNYADEVDEDSDDALTRKYVALCGIQAYFKMVIFDNLIHADLHPGNVLVRMADLGPLARLQRWVLLGDPSPRIPHIVFLDAGLAAGFNDSIFSNVQRFFEAIVACEGRLLGESVLKLAPSQPHVKSQPAFVDEFECKCAGQKAEFEAGGGVPGDNIRAYMQSVRDHRVVLDPTVMVALMSMLVLEGWQHRLDPSVSIYACLETALGGGVVGKLSRAYDIVRNAISSLGGSSDKKAAS